jgi:hypothetical protein
MYDAKLIDPNQKYFILMELGELKTVAPTTFKSRAIR